MQKYKPVGGVEDLDQVRVALVQGDEIVHASAVDFPWPFQPLDAGLTDIAGLAVTDGNIIVGDGTNWVAESGATARASLGVSAAKSTSASVATTSGTTVDFTSIPAGVTRITISLVGVSTNGSSVLLLQIGDSGGIENTGYLGSVMIHASGASNTGSNATTGFAWGSVAAASVYHGSLVLTLQNAATNTWACSGVVGLSNAAVTATTGGSKSLSATLDRVRLTATNGTDAFDAGSANISWEF